MASSSRVLSIQSHVVSGYVGNKSASFPLQVLGFEVDTINSVQFSNHKGYPVCQGQILEAKQLGELYEGLKANSLNHYSHLLTGFIGCQSFLKKVCDVVQDLKKHNPNLIYVCDPVMGDNGKMYVPPDLLPVYRDQVLPLADIITPNQYEAELLTGLSIKDEASLLQVMQRLHELGAQTVVITSSELGPDDYLHGFASHVLNGCSRSIRMEIPRLPAIFTGTGDLMSALLLARLHQHPHDLKLACEKTISTLQHVIRRTLASAQEQAGSGNKPTRAQMELKLIQSKSDIEDPEICVNCVDL